MNKLATELNTVLEGTVASKLLSDLGRRLYFPKGIVAQSNEALEKANKYNATIGMSILDGEPMILPQVRAHLPLLEPKEIVDYAPTGGDAVLRQRWKEMQLKKNPGLKGISTSLPLVVSGLTSGISLVADLFADKGDSVVLPDMFWGNYRLILEERRQAVLQEFPYFSKNGGFSLDDLEKALKDAPQKIIIIFNFPNNPAGYSPSRNEAEQIAEKLHAAAEGGKEILVICDDAYFGLFYEEETYAESLFSKAANLHENILAVKADGFTKEDYLWGFRLGFITFAGKGLNEAQLKALEVKLSAALRSSISNCSRPAQSIAKKIIDDPQYWQEKKRLEEIMHSRFKLAKQSIREEHTVLSALPFNSGYFMSFHCLGIDAEELRKILLEKGIGTISIKGTFLRVAYSSVETNDIPDLFKEIYSAAEDLAAQSH
jgi:aspartate/methionine/tyrosine aminotransferase